MRPDSAHTSTESSYTRICRIISVTFFYLKDVIVKCVLMHAQPDRRLGAVLCAEMACTILSLIVRHNSRCIIGLPDLKGTLTRLIYEG
jgi:hypothetical protein